MFGGLEVGKRALSTMQAAVNIVGNNIANASTPGYSRQQVIMGNTDPIVLPVGALNNPMVSIGTGVAVENVIRARDRYIDKNLRSATSDLGYHDLLNTKLNAVEATFNEPSDKQISGQLDDFFSSWNQLQTPDPSNAGARAQVRATALVLSDSIRSKYESLMNLRAEINTEVADRVDLINSDGAALANLNLKIAGQSLMGTPNDLLDQRDKILSEISKITNIEVVENSDLTVNVSIGGTLLVSGISANKLSTRTENDITYAIWASSNANLGTTSGELKGLIDARDKSLLAYIDQFNTMAKSLIKEVNAIHQAGYDQTGLAGTKFFSGSTAADIDVGVEIKASVAAIAASGDSKYPQGNGANALTMSGLRDKKVLVSDTQTYGDYFTGILTDLGGTNAEAARLKATDVALTSQLTSMQQSISGVSIDEEMTTLMKYQTGYQAAAKFMQTIMQMIDSIFTTLQ